MVSLTNVEKSKLKEILTKSNDKEVKGILKKINKDEKKKYVHDKKNQNFQSFTT